MTTTETDIEIDWEAEHGKRVAENIRSARRLNAKIIDQGEKIQELKRSIAALQADVTRMQPAHERQRAAEQALDKAHADWNAKYREQVDINRTLRTELARGERAAIESAIQYLNERAKNLPRPLTAAEAQA